MNIIHSPSYSQAISTIIKKDVDSNKAKGKPCYAATLELSGS